MLRKAALLGLLSAFAIVIVGSYPSYVERPTKDGRGPLAVLVDARWPAPEYHSPLSWWQTRHVDVLKRGDFAEADCQHCHRPETSCNRCHRYVGAREIVP